MRGTAHNDTDLVKVPSPASLGLTVSYYLSQVGAELGAPDPNRLIADVNAPFEQQFLHVAVRQQKAMVKVHRIRND